MSRYLKEQNLVSGMGKYPTLYNAYWVDQSQSPNAIRRLKMNRNMTVKPSKNRRHIYPSRPRFRWTEGFNNNGSFLAKHERPPDA